MKRSVLFFSFYTGNYAKHAQHLRRSLEILGLDHEIARVRRNSWEIAVRSKPSYMLRVMKSHPEYDAFVWLDADSEVWQYPHVFFKLRCDIAAKWIHWKKKNKFEFQANVIFLRNTENTKRFLRDWIEETKNMPEGARCPEQESFDILNEKTGYAHIEQLPASYSQILREKDMNAVIVQYQASRKWRGVVYRK